MEETKEKKEKKGLKWLGWVVAFPVPLTLTLVRKGGRVRRKAAAIAGAWVAYTVLAYAGATAEVNRLTKPHSYPEPQVIERPYVEKAEEPEEPEAPKEDQVFPNRIDFDDEYTPDFIGVGEVRTLVAVVRPINADNRHLIWESKDESVATVDQYGNVTGVAPGIVNIYAKTEANGLFAWRTIRVKKSKQADVRVIIHREGGYDSSKYTFEPDVDRTIDWFWGRDLVPIDATNERYSGMLVKDREYQMRIGISLKNSMTYDIEKEGFKVTDAELASDFSKTLTVKVEEDLPPFEVTFYFDLK